MSNRNRNAVYGTVSEHYRNMRNIPYCGEFVGKLWEIVPEHVRNIHGTPNVTCETCSYLLFRNVTTFGPKIVMQFCSENVTVVTLLRYLLRFRNRFVTLCSVFRKYQNVLIFTEHGTLLLRKQLRMLRPVPKLLRPVTKIPIFLHATCM